MNKKMEERIIKIVVAPEGEPIFSRFATFIEIDDEVGGEFIKISQHPDDGDCCELRIDPDEWDAIDSAVRKMISTCRNYE